jgi:type IX secretion system PorP/SprF family membrane protein
MKKIFAILTLLLLVITATAQQLPQYSQYMLNSYVINPSTAGESDYCEARSNNRYQWVGFTDAPRTYILSVQGPTKSRKVGLGGYLFTDIVGPTRRIGAYFSYAYHLQLSDQYKVSMALNAGLLQYTVDGSKITMNDPGDLALSNGLQSVLMPDFGFSSYLYRKDKKFFVGVSIMQLGQKVKFFEYETNPLSKLVPHFFLTGGYNLHLSQDFTVQPLAIVKYVYPAPVQLEIGARVIYKDKIWLGGNFRTQDAYSALIGFTYREGLSLGYSYDFTITNVKKYSVGTHEIMLAIRFNKAEKK